MTAIASDLNLEAIAADPNFLGGELEAGAEDYEHFPDGQWRMRGQIARITVLEETNGAGKAEIELEWIACRRNDKDDWVWANELNKSVTVRYRGRLRPMTGAVSASG